MVIIMNNEILFTTASLLDFLSQIDELADKDINLTENEGSIQVQIGESTYDINTNTSEEVEVPDEVVDQVSEIADEAFDDLDLDDSEVVEGGIIKEALKTLAIGGLVRLTGKLVGKDLADALNEFIEKDK